MLISLIISCLSNPLSPFSQVLDVMCREPTVHGVVRHNTTVTKLLAEISRAGTPKTQQAALGALSSLVGWVGGIAEGAGSSSEDVDAGMVSSLVQLVAEGTTRGTRMKAASTLGNLCLDPATRRSVYGEGCMLFSGNSMKWSRLVCVCVCTCGFVGFGFVRILFGL
jgi:hypothetical protein